MNVTELCLKDKKTFTLILPVLLSVQLLYAQQKLPVIKATSKIADVREGTELKKGYWNILPEVKPDILYPERFKGSKRIVFYTDLDSISFEVHPGSKYDFIILLNNRDSAYTQISTMGAPKPVYKSSNRVSDTIPFTLGWNNAIRLKGRINDSEMLDLIFDTGANGIVLSDDALSKNVKLKIDGDIQGYGLGGTSNDKVSHSNQLKIAGIQWDSLSLTVKSQGKPNSDCVIGYNVFDGKIVEIDYDQNIIVIHSKLPGKVAQYSMHDLVFKNGLSFIEVSIDNGKHLSKGWFDFDTGSSGTIFMNNDFATDKALFGTMKKLGNNNLKGSGPVKISVERYLLPRLLLGAFELTNVPVDIEVSSSKNSPPFNIIGNDILKRFNTIIDYRNDMVYLKSNSLAGNMYMRQKIKIAIGCGIAALLLAGLAGFIIYRKRKQKKSTSTQNN